MADDDVCLDNDVTEEECHDATGSGAAPWLGRATWGLEPMGARMNNRLFAGAEASWWRNASIYQVYLRSYKDSNGDGNGDLNGLRAELEHIVALGCDALWLNPIYRSPQCDHGYDVADYRAIDPMYGTLADFDHFLREAHELGLRVVMDIVPNHCSHQHPWFREALAASPDSTARARFLFERGRGENGELPPNSWESLFGGSAWTEVVGEGVKSWYLHAFDSSQPDFNWRNEEVRAEFDSILRWWFDRGVDGFRVDVAHGLVKSDPIPRGEKEQVGTVDAQWDHPGVHAIYRRWRRIANSYSDPRYLIGEVWASNDRAYARYVANDELHQTFAFDLLVQPWIAKRLRAAIDKGLAQGSKTNGPAWTLANHDVHRAVTRYGQEQVDDEPLPEAMIESARRKGSVDRGLGTKRAGAALALMAALPGTIYLYQGEELGLSEHLDLKPTERQDPIWHRSGGKEIGRDGCRIPMPWTKCSPTFGFSEKATAPPWLPQPECYGATTRDEEREDPDSMLSLYRRILSIRRKRRDEIDRLEWIPLEEADALAFDNGAFICVTNTGKRSIPATALGSVGPIVARSDRSDGHLIEADSTVWFERPAPR